MYLILGTLLAGLPSQTDAAAKKPTPSANSNRFVITEGPTVAQLFRENAKQESGTRALAFGIDNADRKALQTELRKCRVLILDQTKSNESGVSPIGKPRIVLSGQTAGVLRDGTLAYVVKMQGKPLCINKPDGRLVDFAVDIELLSTAKQGVANPKEIPLPINGVTIGLTKELRYVLKQPRKKQPKADN